MKRNLQVLFILWCKDNIDPGQIIPVPLPEPYSDDSREYETRTMLSRMPTPLSRTAFVAEGAMDTQYPIVVAASIFARSFAANTLRSRDGCAGRCTVVSPESCARISSALGPSPTVNFIRRLHLIASATFETGRRGHREPRSVDREGSRHWIKSLI